MTPRFAVHAAGSRGLAVVQEVLQLVRRDNIVEVVTARDPGSADDKCDVIQALAQSYGVPHRYRSVPAAKEEPEAWRIFVGWRHMVPVTPRTIILHDSFLPYYRGFAPVVATLIDGGMLGATAFFASERFDEGDIIAQRYSEPPSSMRVMDAFELVAEMYRSITEEILHTLLADRELPRKPQRHDAATYTPWRDALDYYLDWRLDAARLQRTVCALGWPYEGAKVVARVPNGRHFLGIVREASVVPDVRFEGPRPVGKLMFKDPGPVVVCGTGLLRLDKVDWSDGGIGDAFRIRFLLPSEHAP